VTVKHKHRYASPCASTRRALLHSPSSLTACVQADAWPLQRRRIAGRELLGPGGSHRVRGRIVAQAHTEIGRSAHRKGVAVTRRSRPMVNWSSPLAGPKPLAGSRRRFSRLQDAPSDLLTSTMCAACAIDPDCSPPASGCRACSDAWLPARAPASAGCGPSPDPPASAGAAPWPAAACAPGRPPPAANADKLGMLSGGVCGSAGCGGRAARALSTPSARPAGDAVWVGAGCGSAAAVMGRAVRAPLATGGPNPPGAGFVGGREDSMGAQAPSAADAVDARAGRSAAGSG